MADGAEGATLTITDPSRPIVLVGLMATGKSTVAKKLAGRLGLPFLDTDAEIERRQGRSVTEVFETDGEAAFRTLEQAVLAELLTDGVPRVIATGGGAVIAPANREILCRRATVVWLHATPGVLVHRALQQDAHRPLLAGDARATMERLAAEREPWYREVANVTVDVDMVDRRVVLDRVLGSLRSIGAVAPAPASSPSVRRDDRVAP